MTDNMQELDEILWQNIQFTELGEFPEKVPDHKNWVNVMGRIYSFEFTNAKQAILDWHNKQTEALLNELLVDVSSPSANIDQAEMIELINLYINKTEKQ